MRSLFSKSPLFLAALLLSGALACSSSNQKAQADSTVPTADPQETASEPQTISVDEVAQLLAAGECQVVDANGEDTRREKGVVPGAILLSSYSSYSTEELPADKETKLVFYCGNEKCTAAPKAAKRAMEQGYTNVYVMHAGIAGWIEAGKEVSFPLADTATDAPVEN